MKLSGEVVVFVSCKVDHSILLSQLFTSSWYRFIVWFYKAKLTKCETFSPNMQHLKEILSRALMRYWGKCHYLVWVFWQLLTIYWENVTCISIKSLRTIYFVAVLFKSRIGHSHSEIYPVIKRLKMKFYTRRWRYF